MGMPDQSVVHPPNGCLRKKKAKPVSKLLTDEQIRRRKKIGANLAIGSATIGLTSLGAKGTTGILRATKGVKAVKAADAVDRHLQTALIVGTGVGSASALNSAAISRTEAKQRRPFGKSWARGNYINPMAVVATPPNKKTPNTTSGLPKMSTAIKGTLRNVSNGTAPDIQADIPGAKTVTRINRTTGLNKSGTTTAFKSAYRSAGMHGTRFKINPRKGPKATHIMAHKTGAAAHDFREGFRRTIPKNSDVVAGKITSSRNAIYPGAFKTGFNTRRYAVPTAVVGGSYVAGRKLGRGKKDDVAKGLLVPAYYPTVGERVGKSYGYDSEADRHRRAGVMAGLAVAGGTAAGAAGVHQAVQARKGLKMVKPKGRPLRAVVASRGTLVHGGRAAGLLASGTALTAVGVKVRNKDKGSWASY